MLGIVAERADPGEYGFDQYPGLDSIADTMNSDLSMFSMNFESRYVPIQQAFRKNYRAEEQPSNFHWFYEMQRKPCYFTDQAGDSSITQ